jgi:hypothetical protein
MKKIFSLSIVIALMVLFFSSCKKKDAEQTTQQKIQNNWTVVNYTDTYYDAGVSDTETTVADPGDFINFGANGSATYQIEGETGSFAYSIQDDNKLILGFSTYDIRTLTNSELILYNKETISATEYIGSTINLRK